MSNFLIDEDTDLLAAEFVLGTLDSEERASAQSLLRTDHGFIAMVRIWERRFGELHLMVEPVEPDPKLFQRIKAKVAEIAAGEPATRPPPAGATSSPPKAEASQPAETLPDGEPPKPPDAPAPVIPQDAAAAGETAATDATEKPRETPPGTVAPGEIPPTTPEVPAAPEAEGAPVAIPTPAPLNLPDKPPDRERPGRAAEIASEVIRSRGRWRIFGLCMTVLVMGLVALLAAWRFIPDRLPARLRPAELMTSIGIQPLPRAAPVLKPAPPEAQFDE
jgi:pyruvate/2-oxoglutarate dehydrogenase complex dihydrolipoamide acyltransferase (E2) component